MTTFADRYPQYIYNISNKHQFRYDVNLWRRHNL